jgi:hypothetical protein
MAQLGRILCAGAAVTAGVFLGNQAKAGDFYLGGQVRQGISLAIDAPEGANASLGPTQFTAQVQASYKPSSNLTITGDMWLRGDWFYQLNGGHYRGRGIQDFTQGPPFVKQFQYNLSQGPTGVLPQPFGTQNKSQTVLANFNDDMIREFSIAYRDPGGAYSITAGKFQRGWGQADGLRLLDVLYAQDLRQRGIFTDTEDMRLPAWSVALDLNMNAAGIGRPFEFLGMKNASLELLVIPEVRHTEFVINNPTPSSNTNGGVFGFGFPRLMDGISGFGLPMLSANLRNKEVNFHGQEYAARLKFEALGGEATLNGFYGYQDLPIVELTGAQLIIGNALNNPYAAGVAAVVPLDVPSTIGAVHAPGQYVDFIRKLKAGTVAPGDFPLVPFGCNDILVAPPNCSINANFDLSYKYHQKMVGFSFTRDMSEVRLGPKSVSPVLRLEATYEFDKPFNKGVITTPFGQTAVGTPALVTTVENGVARRDVWSALVGVDYNLWLPFWKSQESSIFVTAQFFNIHTDNPKGLLFQSPYAFNYIEKDQQFVTATWTLPLDNQSITFDGLLIWDVDKHGLAYRQRLEFSMMGGRFKPRIEYAHFGGRAEDGILGVYRNADYIDFSAA